MTTQELIHDLEAYFGPWERPGIKAVVALELSTLEPDVRAALFDELTATMSTGWKRAPDRADVRKALDSAKVRRAKRALEFRGPADRPMIGSPADEEPEVDMRRPLRDLVREAAARHVT